VCLVLLEAVASPEDRKNNSVLLTIDLTRAVANEAIQRGDSAVIAYHPIIFRGLKALTLGDSQQQSLLRLASAGISVYSPHTAVDAAPGGLSDWLADIVTGTETAVEEEEQDGNSSAPNTPQSEQGSTEKKLPQRPGGRALQRQYSKPSYPTTSSERDSSNEESQHTRSTIIPSPNPPEGTDRSAGMGRIISFESPHPLPHLVERIARGVGTPAGFHVAIPQDASVETLQIRTVAVCAGSGGSVLSKGKAAQADLWLTGELSHHEALAKIESGGCVVTLGHSNTERGYLSGILKQQLEKELPSQWQEVKKQWREQDDAEEWTEALEDDEIEVFVSEHDRDPFGIVLLQDSQVEGTRLEDGEVINSPAQSGNGRRPG
jgi:dinuclear metal center YbgI/SA1388 family protein